MAITVRASELPEIEPLREKYRKEMDCQIIHDSIHGRAGWTREFALYEDGALIGYCFQTSWCPQGASFRVATASDAAVLQRLQVDENAGWITTMDGEVVGAGGVLYHYNRPYGDVYIGRLQERWQCARRAMQR